MIEVADLGVGLPLDLTSDRQDLTDQNLDQGRLAGAVFADHPHVLTLFQLKAGIIIQFFLGETHR